MHASNGTEDPSLPTYIHTYSSSSFRSLGPASVSLRNPRRTPQTRRVVASSTHLLGPLSPWLPACWLSVLRAHQTRRPTPLPPALLHLHTSLLLASDDIPTCSLHLPRALPACRILPPSLAPPLLLPSLLRQLQRPTTYHVTFFILPNQMSTWPRAAVAHTCDVLIKEAWPSECSE